MMESVAQRGYADTTVAHVIGLAGVSRRAFYELFENKEDCFLATYKVIVASSRRRSLRAWASERGWDNRLHAAYKAFLEQIIEEPKGAHLVLVDSLGIGSRSRERLHLEGFAYERLLAEAFRVSGGQAPPRIISRAIVGGVRQVVYNRVSEDRLPELRTLADELLDWAEAYRTPALVRLKAMMPKVPSIPLASAAFLETEDKRARALGAVVHLTMDEGYRDLTDPHIAKFAGVSTEAFHKEFRSKEECYLTAIDEFAEESATVVGRVIDRAASWPEAVALGIRCFIYHAVARPALLRLSFVDLFELGPSAVGRLTAVTDRLVELLMANSPEPRRAPEIAREAIAGAVWDTFSVYAASDRNIRCLPCLADYIAYFVLAPYLGAREAIDALEQARREPKILDELHAAACGESKSESGAKPATGSRLDPARAKRSPVRSRRVLDREESTAKRSRRRPPQ
jgi:AcrR family transcriptional regulator